MENSKGERTYKTSTLLIALASVWVRKVIVFTTTGADIRVIVVDGSRLFVVGAFKTGVRLSDLKACGVLLSDHGNRWCWRGTGVL